ncbi:MAG: autotransporter-associated beta strand repeat-containing protein [Candidatus Didemnitutus sp.]|nr:autotransporter-associated beta strand repeat-containing protein [Candidatus Didemnitutus sp.]
MITISSAPTHRSAQPGFPALARAFLQLGLLVAGLSSALLIHAQPINGTWTGTSSSGWNNTANWSGGIVAGGAGSIADLSTVNISGTVQANINTSNVTVGTLLLGDTDTTNALNISVSTGYALIFDNNGAGALFHNVPSASNTAIVGSVLLGDNVTIQNDKTTASRFLDLRGQWSAATPGLKTLTFSGSSLGNATINATSGSISDGAGQVRVVQSSLGTLQLNGVNSYSGGTYVNSGKLQVATDANLGASGTSLTLAQGTSFIVTDAFNTSSSQRGLIMNGDATVQTNGFVNWYGVVSGEGQLTKTGSSTLSLNNAESTHSGGIQVDQGTLRTRAGDGALGAASNSLTFAADTTFIVQHLTSAMLTEINAARTATLSSGNVTFDIRTAAVWNGALTGAGGLSKIGTAQFTLNSVADYTGTTAVSVGTFALGANGGLASSQISIADGANFDVSARTGGFRLATGQNLAVAGTGLFTGTLGVGSDTTAETITLSNNLNLASGAGLLFDLGATGDQLAVTGNVSAAGNVSVHLNFLAGFTTGTYTLMSAALITDPGLFVLDEGGLLEGYNYNLLTSGSSLQLAVTAIPEPSTYALLAGVLTLGLAVWRRRTRA